MIFLRSITSRRRWKKFRVWQRIRASGQFDGPWYLAQNPDVSERGVDPIMHYIDHGAAESRDPSADFDTEYYLTRYPDVTIAAINPLDHYIRFGRNEKRETRRIPATRLLQSRALRRFRETATRSISVFSRNCGRKTDHTFPEIAPEHDPEKWDPVFGKDHAPTKSWIRMTIQRMSS